jgi:hybrid cluster-associated redox disulfide protein
MSDIQQFSKDMKVSDALRHHPDAGAVFMSYQLGGCSHCAISHHETIEMICGAYGIPVDDLVDALNALLAKPE